MRSLFETQGMARRPGHGGSLIPHIRPLLPACISPCWLAAVLIIATILPSAGAAESGGEGWQFSASPFLWMPGLEGKIGIRGLTASVDASFIDILDTVR